MFIECTLSRLSIDRDNQPSPGWYALGRISRYAIWVIGLIIGLTYLGLSMTSFAVIGEAYGSDKTLASEAAFTAVLSISGTDNSKGREPDA